MVVATRSDMSDDLQQIGVPDKERINTSQDHELEYWAGKLEVTREQLMDAVQAVGNSAETVRKHLGK